MIRKSVLDAFDSGYRTAFDGFSTPWQTGTFYIVHVDQGSAGLPYEMTSRLPMDATGDYVICTDGKHICAGGAASLGNSGNSGNTGNTGNTGSTGNTGNTGGVPLPETAGPYTIAPTYPVMCGDGTLSLSGGHQGACSHHHGELP